VVSLLAAAVAFVTFVPKLSIQTTGSVRAHDPLGTLFSVVNDGMLDIHSVDARCGVDDIQEPGKITISGVEFGFGPHSHAETLSIGHAMTLPCERIVALDSASHAKVSILVKYRPSYSPFYRNEVFPMEAERAEDDTWIWRRLPN
jgi:hypothetical protein